MPISGGTGKDELRETLREELVSLHGTKRIIPANPYIGDYGSVIPTNVENEVIVWGHLPGGFPSIIIRCTISNENILKVKWSWVHPFNGTFGFPDYIVSLDRLIMPSFSSGYIWELDAKTGAVLNTVDLGANYEAWSVTSIQESPRQVLIPHYNRHYVGRLNLDTGVETALFGVNGVAGDALNRLRNPMTVEYHMNPSDNVQAYFIADAWNNRVLRVNASTLAVDSMQLIAGIVGITARRDPVAQTFNSRRGHPDGVDMAYCRGAATRYERMIPQGWVWSIHGDRPQAFLPFLGGDNAVWSSPNTLWIGYGERAMELDLRYFKEPQKLSSHGFILSNQAVLSGATYPPAGDQYATVLNGLFTKKFGLEVYSSQSANLFIDVPEVRYNGLEVGTGFTWVVYDGPTALTAGQVTPYVFAHPPNIFRPRVVMGGVDGVISIYAHMMT